MRAHTHVGLHAKVKNKSYYMRGLVHVLNNHTKIEINLIGNYRESQLTLSAASRRCDLNAANAIESGMNGKSSICTTIMQSATLMTFIVSKAYILFHPNMLDCPFAVYWAYIINYQVSIYLSSRSA